MLIGLAGYYFNLAKNYLYPRMPASLTSSGNNSKFDFTGKSFEDYITYSKEKIKNNRAQNTDEVSVEHNSPFMMIPDESFKNAEGKYQKGIVLMHGLYDSPYTWRETAEHLNKQGFYVYAPVMPGHGTRSGDLTDVKWQEFVKSLDFAVKSLQDKVEEVHIAGYSTGGAVCLNYYLNKSADIKSIMLVSPALGLTSGMAWLTDYLKYVSSWYETLPEINPIKYQSTPYNSIAQVYQIVTKNDALLENPKIDVPLLMVASNHDMSSSTAANDKFWHSKVTHPQSKFYLYANNTAEVSPKINKLTISPEQDGINAMSHVSILASPHDQYYGKNGSFKDCGAYYHSNRAAYDKCMNGEYTMIAEHVPEFMREGEVVLRATYNPQFDQLLGLIDEFYSAN